jgi:hypothetical protein
VLTHHQSRGRMLPSLGLICLAVLLAACNTGKASSPAAKATSTTGTPVAQLSPVATTPAGVQPTPVSGAYSVYVDPTYGYSFQYPSTWIVQAAIGGGESNVVISEPQPPQTDPTYDTHPLTQLLVRATNDYTNSFVQKLMCNADFSATKVAGYPAEVLDTGGGDPVNGYTAPAFGRAFFAKDKNLAIELWLQAGSKYTAPFFVIEKDHWNQLLASFNPGPGAKPGKGC